MKGHLSHEMDSESVLTIVLHSQTWKFSKTFANKYISLERITFITAAD